MARKKTVKTQPEPELVEDTQNIDTTITNNINTNVSYSGKVTLKIKRGNKVLTSKTFHNSGTNKLFKFIADALAGNFNVDLRPTQIKLFGLQSDPDDLPATPKFTKNCSISTYIIASPAVATAPVASGGYAITYHFSIPSSYITGDKIYKMALYPRKVSNIETDMCAKFLFIKPDETNDTSFVWYPQELAVNIDNYMLLVDWEMKIDNVK